MRPGFSGSQHGSAIPAVQSLLMSKSICPMWASVRAVRTSVRESLLQYPDDFVQAAVMVSSELLENAIKYGEEVAAAPAIQFYLALIDATVQVTVVNGSTDAEAVDDLMRHVRLVRRSDDKEALYLSRLEELLMQPCNSAKLGIYRIAAEGQFEINCAYTTEVVTVTATRSLP